MTYYVTVLDYGQLDAIPSFLEPSEYVISGVVSFDMDSVNLLFANGHHMQIAFMYFFDKGLTEIDLAEFDLSEDGQHIIFGEKAFDVSEIWNNHDNEHIIRSGECTIQ